MNHHEALAAALLDPAAEPRWTIHGQTMLADGPWLKAEATVAVVPASALAAVLDDLRKVSTNCPHEVTRAIQTIEAALSASPPRTDQTKED